MDIEEQKRSIEEFVLNNPQLDNLEDLLQEFNVFETLNILDAEIRHSNVLSWLLNPNSNHGLGDSFVKQFLKYLISTNKNFLDLKISFFDFEIFNYSNIEIRREWMNIDILLLLAENKTKYVIAIENKIRTTEHSEQLYRYRKTVEDEFKNHIKIFVYLTPDDLISSDDHWITFNYKMISEIISNILDAKKNILNENIFNFISHYNTILRRYIVGDSEIEQICNKIYKKHQAAIELIFKYKPDIQLEISDYIQKIVKKENEKLIFDSASKTAIRFTSFSIEKLIKKKSEGWTKLKRIILFEFANYEKDLVLRLYIGPGNQKYRNDIYNFFKSKKSFYKLASRILNIKWHAVYKKEFLKKSDYEGTSFEDLKEIIDKKFDDFCNGDLIQINDHFEKNWKT